MVRECGQGMKDALVLDGEEFGRHCICLQFAFEGLKYELRLDEWGFIEVYDGDIERGEIWVTAI